MFKFKTGRRNLFKLFTALTGSWIFGAKARAATSTPRAAEGPFYPTPSMRYEDVDNDLVKVTGQVLDAGGEVIVLGGLVVNSEGDPVGGLRIEIWQCDMNGKYLHTGDRSGISHDTGFQGFGHDISGPNGSYSFRTIKPAVYPGRTPHIHVKVLEGNREVLTTQFYLADHPGNKRDGLFMSMTDDEKSRVSMTFTTGTFGPEAIVNIVV